jgi:DNA-binding NtrC family response regulator
MLLEIRLEMAETKRILAELVRGRREPGRDDEPVFERRSPSRDEPPAETRTLPAPVPDEEDEEAFADFIEEALFEIESEEQEEDREPEAPEEKPLPTMLEAEKALITEALRRFEGNRRKTARVLGISERTLYRKLKNFDIDE